MTSRNKFDYFLVRCQASLSTWMVILFFAGMAGLTVSQQSSTPELGAFSTVAATSEPLNFSDTSQVMGSTQAEGKYYRALPAVTMPTKLSTNQHASYMAILHPSSTLLAVLSAKHFTPSYLSSDWSDPARVASLQPMTAVVSRPISNLHEIMLGLGSVSKLVLHETAEQLSALQTALSSSCQAEFHNRTLKPDSHPTTSRLPFSPQNCPISAAFTNKHPSSQPIYTQTKLYTYSTPHSNTLTIRNTPIHEYSSVNISTMSQREQKTTPATKSQTNKLPLSFTTCASPDFSSFMELNPMLTHASTCISLSSRPIFNLFPNQFSIVSVLVATKLIIFLPQNSLRFFNHANSHHVFNLSHNQVSLERCPCTHLYLNHINSNEVSITLIHFTTTLIIDQLQRSTSFAGENRSVTGNSISSLQSIPFREVSKITLDLSLTLIADLMTNADQSQSISVANMTPAPLHIAPDSQGSGCSRLSSATTLLLALSLDLSTPTSADRFTATLSGRKLPPNVQTCLSPSPNLWMETNRLPPELGSRLRTETFSISNSGQVMTPFPISMSSLDLAVSFGIASGYSSLPHLESRPSLKVLTIVESADQTEPLVYELRSESNLIAKSIQSLSCSLDQGVSFPFYSRQTLSCNSSKTSWSSLLESRTVASTYIIDPTPDTNLVKRTRSLHFITQNQEIIKLNLLHVPVVYNMLRLPESGIMQSIFMSLTSSAFTAPSFERPTIPFEMTGQTDLLFQSPDPIQTFRYPISPTSALSLFNQSPLHYLPRTVSMTTTSLDIWEIVNSAPSNVFRNYQSLVDANPLYKRGIKEIETSNLKKKHILSSYAPDDRSNTLSFVYFYFSLVYFLSSSASAVTHSMFSSSSPPMLYPSLSFLSIPFLSLLPLSSSLSSLDSEGLSKPSITPIPMQISSIHIHVPFPVYSNHSSTMLHVPVSSSMLAHSPSLPLHSLPSNPSTSGYPLPLETYSFHAPISSLSNSSVNNPLRSEGLPQITSVIATPSFQYPGGNSRPLTMSAYASMSPVSAWLVSGATKTSLNLPMQEPSLSFLISLSIPHLTLESPDPLMHETASLHLASASLVLRASEDASSDLSQMIVNSMSQSLTLLSTVVPISFSHPSSALLHVHASFNSDLTAIKQSSSGLVTPSLTASPESFFSAARSHTQNHLSLGVLSPSLLETLLLSNSNYVERVTLSEPISAPMITQSPSSSILMPSFSRDASLSSATPISFFQHSSNKDAIASPSMHPPSLTHSELSSIASFNVNVQASSYAASFLLLSNTSSSLRLPSSSSSSPSSPSLHASISSREDSLSQSSYTGNQMSLSLVFSISSSFALFPANSHQPHQSLTSTPDRITPVTSSPLSSLPPVGPVATPASSLTSASSLPSSPSPFFQTESNIAMATSMLMTASASWRNISFQNTAQVFSSVMNSQSASETLSSVDSGVMSKKLGVESSVNSLDASALLETLLLTQTSYEVVTLSDFDKPNSESSEIESTYLQSLDMITQPGIMFSTPLTPSFVTPITRTSSLVSKESSFSALTQLEHLTSVYESNTLKSTPYYVETLTISSTLTQYSKVLTPNASLTFLSSNSYVLESIGLDSTLLEEFTLTPTPIIIETQTPYTTSMPIYETMSSTQALYTQSTPLSNQVQIQTPTASISSTANQSSTLLSSNVSFMQSMPNISASSASDPASMQIAFTSSLLDSILLLTSMKTNIILASPSDSDAAYMQMTVTSLLLDSTLSLTSLITKDASMSYGGTITSMPFDVSVNKTFSSSSVSMPHVSVLNSVDNLSPTDGTLTSTFVPSPMATASRVQLQTSAPSSSFLSSVVSTELRNASTEVIGTLYSSPSLDTISAIVKTPLLSSSVQSLVSSVQTNESMLSSSSSSDSSLPLDVLSSTYATMSSDVISLRNSMMPTMSSSSVNESLQSTIMPSSSMVIRSKSLILNSTMSSLMNSLSQSVTNQTGAMPLQPSTSVVESEIVSTTIMSSIAALPTSSAGRTIVASSVVTESSASFVHQQNVSLSPATSSSGFNPVSSSSMTTKTLSSSSSQMVLPTPNMTSSSDSPGMSSNMPTPSLPIMPSSGSPLPPNSTLYTGVMSTSIFSVTPLTSSVLSTSLSLAPTTSLMETENMNLTFPSTTMVSVEILSTPLASLSTLSPTLSVSMSTLFLPTSPTPQVNMSTVDATPVVVSIATTSFSTEPPTSAVSTSQGTLLTSTPAAENATVGATSTSAVMSSNASSSTPVLSTLESLNHTMTSAPASEATSLVSLPSTTAISPTPGTTPMVTTAATTPPATAPPTTEATTPAVSTTTLPPVVTISQEPGTTQTMTPTPFDTSFATKPYWLTMGLGIDENVDIKMPSYVEKMERNLATMYLEADHRSNQRMVEVEDLLEQLDPEKNPALGPSGRRRRAVTVDTITAQIIDLTRQDNPTDVELTFYIVQEGTKMLSGDARIILDELTLQEMTLYLDEPVNSPPIEVVPSTTIMPSANPPARLWIIAAVLVPLALLFFCCLCCCCCCCGRKPRKEDGPMDPDTFKMLQFKAKYPYRQYPASPQDQQLQPVPRGFDVVKQDYANNAFGMEAGTLERKQQIEEEAEMMIQRELPRRTVEGHVSPVLHSSRHQYPVGQSPTPSGSSSSSLVPPLPIKQSKGHQRSKDASTSGSDTGEELYKQRREYMAAQEEISRVLEPELYSSQGRKSQKAKAGAKKTGVQKMKERKAEGEKSAKNKLKKMESLPDNHYARAGVGAQDEGDNHPAEPLQETKQKMHALIDEAFSLVGKTSPSKNAVVPLSGGLSHSQNYSREEGKKTPRDSSQQEVPRQLFAPVVPPITRRKPKDSLKEGGTQTLEMGQTTRVVVVPVTKPPQEGSSIVWSPYTAGDETATLSPSQEPASLPGGLNPSPIPSPRGVSTNHQQALVSSRERRPDGDSLRGTKQGVVERYADMLQDMLTSQLPLPPEDGGDIPSKGSNKRKVTLLEGEPDYDWSFDRSINGSQRVASKARSPLPERTKSNKTEKDSASASMDEVVPSLASKEKGVGKAVDKFYDELDVSSNLKYPTGQYSPQVANAVREELIRLTRRMGDGEESGLV